jgi:hypothetical protein
MKVCKDQSQVQELSPYINGASNCCFNKTMDYIEYLYHLASSNFTLMIRGGDAGSSRTFDSISIGTPQIVISDKFMQNYAPFKCIVPWNKFLSKIQEKEFNEDPKYTFRKHLNTILPQREKLKRIQDSYKRDLIWNQQDSIAANNLMIQIVYQCDKIRDEITMTLREKISHLCI